MIPSVIRELERSFGMTLAKLGTLVMASERGTLLTIEQLENIERTLAEVVQGLRLLVLIRRREEAAKKEAGEPE